jgi:hypothetical protein
MNIDADVEALKAYDTRVTMLPCLILSPIPQRNHLVIRDPLGIVGRVSESHSLCCRAQEGQCPVP